MKKILLSIYMFIIALSLTGCEILTPQTGPTIDVNSIVDKVYSSVYKKCEDELYDKIYSEVREEFLDGKIDAEVLQQQIYTVSEDAIKANLYVVRYGKKEGLDVQEASGSGVIFKKEVNGSLNRYYFITNHHVISGGTKFEVTLFNDDEYEATLVGSDKTTDIALLYFESNKLYQTVELGSSSSLRVGQVVLACGNPKGISLRGSVSFGIVNGLNRNLIENGSQNSILEFVQHDAVINSGNSGGGLFNLDGECVGINSIKYVGEEIEGLNFAIPIDLVKEVISEIEEYGSYSGKVSLGITVTPVSLLTSMARKEINLPESVISGIYVASVEENTSAYGKLEVHDVIIKFDNVSVVTSNDLSRLLALHKIGDKVSITVVRNGVEVTVEITFIRHDK